MLPIYKVNPSLLLIGDRKSFSKTHKDPGIGVGIFLVDPLKCKFLIGMRIESRLFGLPGGWLEPLEEWEECASRELKEETGLFLPKENFNHVFTLNIVSLENNYHTISCIMYAEIREGEKVKIKNAEPTKCGGWFWSDFEEIHKNYDKLFYPLQTFLTKFPNVRDVSALKEMICNYSSSVQ